MCISIPSTDGGSETPGGLDRRAVFRLWKAVLRAGRSDVVLTFCNACARLERSRPREARLSRAHGELPMRNRCVNQVRARLAMRAAERQKRPAQPRRSFSARARRAAVLAAQGHSRKEIAALIGVAPETISVWKRHPQ
jgi:DNA-binding CsgD family transcriptional regulator